MSFENLNNTLSNLENYAGKFFLGTVLTMPDPLKLDRVKVYIPGLYPSDPAQCPWCGPLKSSPMGQGLNFGTFGVPPEGSTVLVLLQDGNPHYPIYLGGIQTTPSPAEFPAGTWGWKDKHGNSFVFGPDGLTITTTEIKLNGKLTATGDVVAGGKSLINHTHDVLSKDYGSTSPAK